MKFPPREARSILAVRNVVTVVFPPELPPKFNGCQRSWMQYDEALEKSIPLLDTYFVAGRPVRFLMHAPGADSTEIAVDCRYVNGTLDVASSVKPGVCPSALKLLEASKGGAVTPVPRIH